MSKELANIWFESLASIFNKENVTTCFMKKRCFGGSAGVERVMVEEKKMVESK